MDEDRETRQELRRLAGRFVVAVSLRLFSGFCERAAGFNRSDANPGTETVENGHGDAFYWASKFHMIAHFCFLMVISKILLAQVPMMQVVERLRRLREDCDFHLVVGLICVMISFSFMAYLRWFVVA